MTVYDISSILDINKDGLVYLDENGDKQHIDFYMCRSNWVKHVNESKKYITWDGEPVRNISEEVSNCVGQPDWFFEKPYYEFFTNPIIKFEITPKRRFWDVFNKHWIQRYYSCFYSIQKKINDAGWSTFDLG
jgi:hypothetical protein